MAMHSIILPTGYPNWPEIVVTLESLIGNPSVHNLKSSIAKFGKERKKIKHRWQPEEEEDSFLQLTAIVEENPERFSALLPLICQKALDMPSLFPDGTLQILGRGSEDRIELSLNQVSCLLAHMFLCSIQPSSGLSDQGFVGQFVGQDTPYDPITFRVWYSWVAGSTDAYLRTLFHYFQSVLKDDLHYLENGMVIFQRVTLKLWDIMLGDSNQDLVIPVLHLEGTIGDWDADTKQDHVQVDFANENVGFGKTGTQEELLLGMSPEACVVVLFNEILNDEDALYIQGARIFGTYTGYGSSVRFAGPNLQDLNWSRRKILAMDALQDPGSLADQVSDVVLQRELKKSFAAFSAVSGEPVSTGHWGCGVFGGDKGLKALVQVLSASMANIHVLHFYTFGDEAFHQKFSSVLHLLKNNQVKVGQLWNMIRHFKEEFNQHNESAKNLSCILQWILDSQSN